MWTKNLYIVWRLSYHKTKTVICRVPKHPLKSFKKRQKDRGKKCHFKKPYTIFLSHLGTGLIPNFDSDKTRPDHNAWSEVQLKIVDTEVKLKRQVKVNLLCFAGQGASFSSYEISGLLPSLKIYSSRASLWVLMHENTYYECTNFKICTLQYVLLPSK